MKKNLKLKAKEIKNNRGYVAMSTVLVIGVILLSTGMAVILNSINESQSSTSDSQKEKVIGFVESCAQDALLRLNNNNALPGSIVLPDGSCTVTINSQIGNDWDFSVSGSLSGYQKVIRVSTTRTTTIVINSWIEI
jgi:uncharacterized protein (UPF0333 family)